MAIKDIKALLAVKVERTRKVLEAAKGTKKPEEKRG